MNIAIAIADILQYLSRTHETADIVASYPLQSTAILQSNSFRYIYMIMLCATALTCPTWREDNNSSLVNTIDDDLTRNVIDDVMFVDVIGVFAYSFLPCDAVHKRGLCHRACGVRPSVCPSRSCILWKSVNMFSNFFHHLVATPF